MVCCFRGESRRLWSFVSGNHADYHGSLFRRRKQTTMVFCFGGESRRPQVVCLQDCVLKCHSSNPSRKLIFSPDSRMSFFSPPSHLCSLFHLSPFYHFTSSFPPALIFHFFPFFHLPPFLLPPPRNFLSVL